MTKIYTHPGQPQMQVEVILASQGPNHKPIYTIRMRYPRPIHGEIMTHRVFGRNARSSRAVPVRTMLLECTSIPYIPWHWGKNQRGMQAEEECNELITVPTETGGCFDVDRETAWLQARDAAVAVAEGFMNAGYHKQNPNRLLEPFSWIDTLITSTDWDNFLWLRDHKDAEPHLQDLARLVKQAIDEAEIQPLQPGEWHMSYITPMDIQNLIICPDEDTERAIDELGCDGQELLNMVSAARCARISYKPFDGNAAYRAEFDRYNLLVTSDRVHASPLEHQATPDKHSAFEVSQLINTPDGAENSAFEVVEGWCNPELHGNLDGYIQARKLVPNEVYSSN